MNKLQLPITIGEVYIWTENNKSQKNAYGMMPLY